MSDDPKQLWLITTPSVRGPSLKEPPSRPSRTEDSGNWAYPATNPAMILSTIQIFKYSSGSHIVVGLSVSISSVIQVERDPQGNSIVGVGIFNRLIPVVGSPLGVRCAKQNSTSISVPIVLLLNPGVPGNFLESWFKTAI